MCVQLVKVEVEKETIEVEVRRQVTEDMQALMQEAAAAHKEATEKLRQELLQERRETEQLRQQLEQEGQERQRLQSLLAAQQAVGGAMPAQQVQQQQVGTYFYVHLIRPL